MYKKFSPVFLIGIIGLFILFPQKIFGAQLIFKEIPNNSTEDKTTIVEVSIKPESKKLNVVEGEINFNGIVSDKLSVEINADDSILTLWVNPPQYFPSEKVVRFIGGVPEGFNKEGLLFRMYVSSFVSGEAIISWDSGMAYLNDGKGTKENISANSININLNQQDSNLIKETKTSQKQNNKVFKIISNFNLIIYVILLLVLVFITFFIFRYEHKKNIKK